MSVPEVRIGDVEAKRAGACSICDDPVRDVRRVDVNGCATAWGPRLAGTRSVLMAHLDGSHSEHSLCSACVVTPEALPRLWMRACLAYGQLASLPPGEYARFVTNPPVAILTHKEASQ